VVNGILIAGWSAPSESLLDKVREVAQAMEEALTTS